MPEFSVDLLLLLSMVAFAAGFVDAIAGGGGLLTIPALLFAGLNPVQAISTNKLQASFGSFTASRYFIKQGLVQPKEQWFSLLMVALGAGLGSLAIQYLSSDLLLKVLPYLLILIAIYLFFGHNFGKHQTQPKVTDRTLSSTLVPSVGFYDGFFGPGTGTFLTLGYCQLGGRNFLQATAQAKLLNFATNLVSLLVFLLSGQIVWAVGLSMAVGQTIGARFGAATALKRGVVFIRLITVIVCVVMSVSLLTK